MRYKKLWANTKTASERGTNNSLYVTIVNKIKSAFSRKTIYKASTRLEYDLI